MPVLYVSKMQYCVEISTYGAEFSAMKTCVEELTGVRTMLREMGFTMDVRIFCDYAAVFTLACNVNGLLKRLSTALAYHLTRETLEAGVVKLQYVLSGLNVSNIFTKSLANNPFNNLSKKLVVGYCV